MPRRRGGRRVPVHPGGRTPPRRTPLRSRRVAPLGGVGSRVQRMTVIGVGVLAAGSLIVAGVLLVARGGSAPPCTPDPSGWNGAGGGPAQRGAAPPAPPRPGSHRSPVWASPPRAGPP